MSRFAGHSDVDAVRGATDLVKLIGEHIALKPKGREHVGLCPFHDDKNPSMAVVTHKGNAFYKCFACGAGGDAFDFVMNYHRMEFGDALRHLADRAGIKLTARSGKPGSGDSGGGETKLDLRKANAFAATYFQRTLRDERLGATAREAIAQRGISDEMVEAFMLGTAPDQWDGLASLIERRNLPEKLFISAGLLKPRKESEGFYDAFRNRLIFPICDELGNPIAFGGRKINPEDEPKYLNSSESALFNKSRTLYGLNRAKRAIIEARSAIVTEGYTDVIACHQAGICNVVGTLGTALTREHARLLARLCDAVVLVFDGDEAGQKAADRGLEVFFAEPVDVKICVLPDQFDPDELLKEANGRERFEAAVASAIDALAYKINRFRGQVDGAGLSGRQKKLEQFLAELSDLGFGAMQGVRKSLVLSQLSQMMNVPMNALEAAIPKTRRTANVAATASNDAPAADVQINVNESVSPARRRAERELLAVLMFDPQTAIIERIGEIQGDAAQVVDLFAMDDFLDPPARALADVVFGFLRQSREFTVQQVMDAFEDQLVRGLASSLFFDGRTLCESPPLEGLTPLQAAVRALQDHINLDEYHQTVSSVQACRGAPEQALAAAQTVIAQRRRHGQIAAAIGRGVRS